MVANELVDRKLRQIYDAFDVRNHKLALKLATAAVQKHPENQMMRALKAVALERTGKREEAMKAVDELLSLVPTASDVLGTLVYVLRPAGKLAMLTAAFEKGVLKDPGNEDMLTGLFNSYVRDFSFVKQQQAALKLQKSFPSEQHQWWIVDSIALQAHAAADAERLSQAGSGPSTEPTAATGGSLGAGRLLQLAESMSARLVSQRGGEIQGMEALDLYLGFMFAQGKAEEALALVDGPLGGSAIRMPSERRQARAALLAALGRRREAAALYREAVQQQPDDWASIVLYLDCLLPAACASGQAPPAGFWGVARALGGPERLVRGNGEEAPGGAAAAAAEAAAFFEELPAGPAGGGGGGAGAPVLRGPALAWVELAARRLALGLSDAGAVAQAALACYDRLSHLLSCAMDLRSYVSLLPGTDAGAWLDEQLSSRLASLASAAEDEAAAAAATDGKATPEAQAVLRRRVCALQLQELLCSGAGSRRGAAMARISDDAVVVMRHRSCSEAARASEMVELFRDSLPLSNGLDERERGPADELLSMAAACLMRGLSGAAGGPPSARLAPLLRAVVLLEAGVCGRPYGAACRLGLTGLYGLLGCASAAAVHFWRLEVKHIQLDTLASHHLLPLALALGADKESQALLLQTLALFEDHMRDAGDTLMLAYKQDTHTKVMEFVLFKERLERAHSFALARAEEAILKMRQQLAAGASSSSSAAAPSAAAAASAPSGPGAGAAGGPAAAAAAALPLDELRGPSWSGMRFNADLQTREPWLPPAGCAAHVALMHWWETTGAGDGSMTDRCWWQQVGAAEADLEPAKQLRSAQRDGALQRWLLPHLLAAALAPGNAAADKAAAPSSGAGKAGQPKGSGSSGGGAGVSGSAAASGPAAAAGATAVSEAAAGIGGLLPRFASALGVEEIEAAILGAFGGSDGGWQLTEADTLAPSRQLQMLELALFHAADAAVQMLGALAQPAGGGAAAGGGGDLEAASEAVSQRAAVLASGMAALDRLAARRLSPGACCCGLLGGDALSLAALLVDESCLWAVCCFESWSKAVKACKKKQSKKSSSAIPAPAALASSPAVQSALSSLSSAAAATASLLKVLSTSSKQLLQQQSDSSEPELLKLLDPDSSDEMRRLAGWEARLSVQHVVKTLMGEQRQQLQRVAAAAGALQQRLAAVGW